MQHFLTSQMNKETSLAEKERYSFVLSEQMQSFLTSKANVSHTQAPEKQF